MKLEKGMISNSQLMFMIIAFMMSMALTVGFCFPFTKQDTWIVVPVAYVITLLAARVYLAIAKRYPGKGLLQINEQVFGAYAGKVISVLYIWFFFQVTVHYMYFFNSFWITYIMPETPRIAFLVMFGLVCALAVREGLETIARCCFLFGMLIWITTITLTTLLIGDMEPSNLLPLLDVSLKNFVQSTHIMVTLPFCDIVVFLMIFPYVEEQEKLKKPVILSISLCTLELFVVVIRDTLVLGTRVSSSVSASFAAARQIDLADILTRMDILVAIALLVTVFTKVIIFYYATALGTAQLLRFRSYAPLVIPIGVLAVTVGAVLYPSDMEQAYAAENAWPLNATVPELLLPVLTLAVMGIRSLAGRTGKQGEGTAP